jgi:hypothetical protein
MSDLPIEDQSLNCGFQRRDKGAKKIECALTEKGGSSLLYTMVDRDQCTIDKCPIFQTWKLLMKKNEASPANSP